MNGLIPIYFGKTVPSDNNSDGRYYTRNGINNMRMVMEIVSI